MLPDREWPQLFACGLPVPIRRNQNWAISLRFLNEKPPGEITGSTAVILARMTRLFSRWVSSDTEHSLIGLRTTSEIRSRRSAEQTQISIRVAGPSRNVLCIHTNRSCPALLRVQPDFGRCSDCDQRCSVSGCAVRSRESNPSSTELLKASRSTPQELLH